MFLDGLVNVHTRDIAQAPSFCRDLLGFEPLQFPPSGEPEQVELSGGADRPADVVS